MLYGILMNTVITRSGRISKKPERLDPEEDVEDDYSDEDYEEEEEEDLCETDDEDEDDEDEEDAEDADENGNLKGFVVDDEDA